MTEVSPTVLAEMEQDLRREAEAFMRNANQSAEPAAALKKTIFTPLNGPRCDLTIGVALERLEKKLAAQRRWSRTHHHAYDLNRHILLERTCSVLRQRDPCATAFG